MPADENEKNGYHRLTGERITLYKFFLKATLKAKLDEIAIKIASACS